MMRLTEMSHSHLRQLEADAIRVLREIAALHRHAALLLAFDSRTSVLLHLARKAFYPDRVPLRWLQMSTPRSMTAELDDFRTRTLTQSGMPADHWRIGVHDVPATDGLGATAPRSAFDAGIEQAARHYQLDALVDARWSASVVSDDRGSPARGIFRLWNHFHLSADMPRFHPLEDWSELDIWNYVQLEALAIAPLYYAAPRAVLRRQGVMMLAEAAHEPAAIGAADTLWVRASALSLEGHVSLVESRATSVQAILREMLLSRLGDNDADGAASWEVGA